MRVNSIRKKVIKPMMYQIKEYLGKNLTYLIPCLESFIDQTSSKNNAPRPSSIGRKGLEKSSPGLGRDISESRLDLKKISVKQYKTLIDDFKALYGLNMRFCCHNFDISVIPRLKLLKSKYNSSMVSVEYARKNSQLKVWIKKLVKY